MKPRGFLTVTGWTGADGEKIATQRAVDLGWVVPCGVKPNWGIERHEVPLGFNLFTDNGRQALAYLLGGRAPTSDYYIQYFGVGTGTTAPTRLDTGLEAPVYFDPPTNTVTTKLISGTDWPSPYVLRVEFTLATTEANGYLLTELGLFTGNGTLAARRVLTTGINKSSSLGPTLLWRIRT